PSRLAQARAMRKIETVTVRPVNVPLARPIRTAVGFLPTAPLVLIDVRASDGIVGSAYLFAYKASMLKPLVATVEAVAGEVIGQGADPHSVSQRLELSFRLLGRQGLVALAM